MGLGEPSSLARDEHQVTAQILALKPRCAIWGVLNATPDSFSDGGEFMLPAVALRHAARLIREGADVVDVGGESSRPAGQHYGSGAASLALDVELARVIPLISAIRAELGGTVSIDTVKPQVARRAIEAGASIVNDVSCGASDGLLDVVAQAGVELVLMHTRGRGELSPANTTYANVVQDVVAELMIAVARAVSRGVQRERIWIDPGIGFAKTAAQSLTLLASTDAFVATGQRVMMGPSRKSFIATIAPDHGGGIPLPVAREGGTAAAVTLAVLGGAHAVRVHDVAPLRQAVLIAERARDCAVHR